MKYIFDFDDVIFDAGSFKNRVAESLLSYGISQEDFLTDYARVRGPGYHVSKHVADIFGAHNIGVSEHEINDIVDELFVDIKQLLNKEVVYFISEHAKDVAVLSAGNADFQMRKIVETGIKDLVSEIVIVPHSKKEWVIAFAEKYPDEVVYFIDNSEEHLVHVEFDSLSNLKTVLYRDKNSLNDII